MATQTITLGGGCFWCIEAVYKRIEGIAGVTSGYAGGDTEHPTYEEVCSGRTGHAEVVRVEYDPEVISTEDVVRRFFDSHDPTTVNRQGNDVGTQYRSIVLYENEEQREAAEKIKAEVDEKLSARVVTEIEPLGRFYRAEDYHQDYFDKHPNAGYCRLVIAPKLKKLGIPPMPV
ncbi:MAG: peptide-methionine (S)-S-oxide reductase MsrA [Spirochaetota bacterium]